MNGVLYFFGFLLVGIGFLVIWKSEIVFGWIGEVEWAEQHMGPGQSRTFIKLMGLALIVVSFLMMTGWLQGFLVGIFIR